MKNTIFLSIGIIITLQLFYSNLSAQIITGQDTGQVYYYDFIPDSSLTNTFGQYGTGYCKLDLNGDSINDFEIKVRYSHAPGFTAFLWYIKCLNNNEIVVNTSGDVDTLPLNELIDQSLNWSTIDSLIMGGYSHHNISQATNYSGPWSDSILTDKYVGVRIISLTDTIYGYIHVCRCASGPNLLIKDYGLELLSVLVNDEMGKDNFQISPNPTSGVIIINSEVVINNGTVQLFNILGEPVYTETILNESRIEINAENFISGVYFVTIFDGKKFSSRKLLINHYTNDFK